jgi:purine nucleoside phosphorylase
LGMDYAGLAVISNWAAGVSDSPLLEDDFAATLRAPMSRVRRIIAELARHIAAQDATGHA